MYKSWCVFTLLSFATCLLLDCKNEESNIAQGNAYQMCFPILVRLSLLPMRAMHKYCCTQRTSRLLYIHATHHLGPSKHFSNKTKKMGQAMNRAKNDGKTSNNPSDSKTLRDIIDKMYEDTDKIKDLDKFEDFYHAVYEIIQELRERTGAIQLKLRSSAEIKDAYEKYRPKGYEGRKPMSREECEKIIKDLIKMDDVHIGKKAVDILALIYGAPICAFLAKRIIPGANSFSDDVVVPAATAGAALFLAKTNKL